MWTGTRSLTVLMTCCVVGLVSSPVTAVGDSSLSVEGTGASLSLESSLVVPGSLTEGEQLQAQEQAKLANPEAVAAREESRTKYEGLSAEKAVDLASEVFPKIVGDPAGGPPSLPAGQQITGYLSDNAASVNVGGGGQAVLESSEPIAMETSSGQHTPLDLSLGDDGSSFRPVAPVVAVSISKRLGDGVDLPGVGVSLTPVDGSGSPLGGSEGVVDGASVLYANTETDTDALVKPTTTGFEADTLLRSVDSPQQLFFHVGMPTGASIVQAKDGSGAVQVVKEHAVIATILSPDAHDAAGTAVPVSMSLSGETLALSVDDHSGEYQYPVAVDPEVKGEDSQLVAIGSKRSNWEFYTSNGKGGSSANFASSEAGGILKTYGVHEYKEGESASWVYQTRGVSKIYEFNGETEASNKEDRIESIVELQHEGGLTEEKELLSNEAKGPVEYTRKPLPEPLCPRGKESCVPNSGNKENAVHFQQSVVNSPTSKYSFSDELDAGTVYIAEPSGTHSTTSENTTTPEIEVEVENSKKEKEKQSRKNALYGTSNWLSEYDGAIQFISKDTGIGVSSSRLEYENAGKWEALAGSEHNYLEEALCKGVQCEAEQKEYWTLNPHLPNGEDKIRYRAEEAFGDATHETESLPTEGTATVKVDRAKPHGIFLSGLPYGNELSERAYKLRVEATDGEGTTIASSGVASIKLAVDGKEEVLKKIAGTGECSTEKGECTASNEWEINGAELGAGHHAIVIVVKDRAGNEKREEESISIRHSTPVALGPGSVDLESGDFSMGATDVSMGSGLGVSRAYSSRATEEGDEGPLGPEWSMSLTSTESLVEMVDGSLLMTTSNGSQTIFAKPLAGVKCESKAPFESPPGNNNLTLWCEENKETKKRIAYYLENATDHTKVKFTQPTGATTWVPTKQEGTVATDTVIYSYATIEGYTEYPLPSESRPEDITTGPDNNLWFTNLNTSKIGKITTTGSITEYSLPGGSSEPRSIIAGPNGNLWFTNSASQIGQITTAGQITEYSLGSQRPAFNLTPGPDGNVWFTDAYRSTVGKITLTGGVTEYSMPAESEPRGIVAGPDGNLWVTEYRASKIVKMTTSGVVLAQYALPAESEPTGITVGPDSELWFGEFKTHRIGKITTSGVITEYSLPSGAEGGSKIVTGPDGNLWFAEYSPGKIAKITTSGTISQYTLPKESFPDSIMVGPDNNIWFTDNYTEKIGVMPTSGTITEPTEALAPVPAGVSCSWTAKPTEMQPGCRALEFKYATETTAKGEGKSEWGEYNHRLAKILLVSYNSATKAMEEPTVAEYSYDTLGRLRAEWDPRVSPALKTMYGYDEHGHVTALDPPGQEPWSLTYGTSTGDSGTGRLLKMTRAPASESLWGGETVKSTEAPKITGSPVVGVRLAVSNGKWSGGPLTYGYQWEECTSSNQCTPILGADNANYTPVSSNVGHTIVALVTATNGGGSSSTVTAATAAVTGRVSQSIDSGNSINAVSCVPATTDCVLSDSKGNAFYSTNVSTASSATWKAWSGPTGASPSEAIDCPSSSLCLLADGERSGGGGALYDAKSLGGSWQNAYEATYGALAVSCPSVSFCVTGNTAAYVHWSTEPGSSWEEKAHQQPFQSGNNMNAISCLSSSFCVIANSEGDIYAATTTAKIESAEWLKTEVDSNTFNGVACTSTSSCIAVDSAGNVLNLTVSGTGAVTFAKHNIDSTNSLTAVTCSGSSTCVTVDNTGNVFGSKNGGETWTKVYSLGHKLTSVSCASTLLCATADTTGTVTSFNPAGATGTEGELHSPNPGTTVDYNVPVSGGEAPHNMSEIEVAKWAQKAEETPVEATAILPPDSPQGWPASSYKRATVYYLDEQGRNVNVAQPSTTEAGSISTTEYNEYNDIVRTLIPDNRESALKEGCESETKCESAKKAKLLSTENTYNGEGAKEKEVAEPGTKLIETVGPQHEIKYMEGKEQKESLARNHEKLFYEDEAAEAETKEKYDLVTRTTDLAQLANEEEREVRHTTTSYSGQKGTGAPAGLGWKLREPTSVTVEPEGAKITHSTLYYEEGNEAMGQVMETRGPEGSAGNSAHDAKIVYYSAEENKEGYAGCGKHPEWAGLVCETLPAKQPETTGVPNLPVTKTVYNMWDEPETVEETFPKSGSFAEHTRTKKEEYDAAGRMKTSEETSTATTETTDKALPKVTNVYSEKSGALEKQSTTVSGKTKTITNSYNTLGQLESYTDSDGNIAKFKYAAPENDGLLEEMSDGSNGGESNQKYTYSETTKQLTKLVDSAAGTFTASYDTEGKLTSEVYPNGMCAAYTRNPVGEATHIEYTKTTSCSEKEGVWFSETKAPSVRGETMSRTSTLANEEYAYDTLGRLTETRETPAGEYCKTRIYAYDEESNRTKLTTREPNTKKECATEGGVVQEHAYDEANRLADGGMTYDPLGNVTKLPAGDAEGHALESAFYVDNAVATQTQNGVTNNYYMDPEGRARETVTGAKKVITHYDGSGEAVAWTCEGAEKGETCETTAKWTRNIPGIDGALAAIQNGTGAVAETPVLQLHDLQGDVVATIKDKTGETKLESTYNSTEFGVPNGGKEPPKFAWLGAGGVEKSLASGVITEGATSYVPQTGRALQSEAVVPPGLPGGSGGQAAAFTASPWNLQGAERVGAEAPGLEAGREREAEEAACRANLAACEEGSDPEFGENTHGCKVWASWGSVGFSNDLTVYGHFKCTYASYGFELGVELQLIEYGGVLGGIYKLEKRASKVFGKSENGGEHSEKGTFECMPGKWYRLVAWGRYWYTSGYSPWHAYSVDGRPLRCPQQLPEGEPPRPPR
jgi:streptogramin lyase